MWIVIRHLEIDISFPQDMKLYDLNQQVASYFGEVESESENVSPLSHVRLFATPWNTACQPPLSMGFPR